MRGSPLGRVVGVAGPWGVVYLAILFWAPLPLGSNRLWSGLLLAALALLVLIPVYLAHNATNPGSRNQRVELVVLGALALFAAIPFFQLILAEFSAFGMSIVSCPPCASYGGPDEQRILIQGLEFAGYAAAFYVPYVLTRRDTRFLQLLSATIVLVATLNTVYGLINFFGDGVAAYFRPALWRYDFAVNGTYVNKNHFASLVAMAIPLLAALPLFARQGRHAALPRFCETRGVWWFVVLFILLSGLVMSVSRGAITALVAAGITTAVLAVSLKRNAGHFQWAKGRWALVAGLIAAVMVILFAPAIYGLYANRPLTASRLEQWASLLPVIHGAGLVGGGAGNFEWISAPFRTIEMGGYRYDHAHNDYLEVLITTGVLGLGALVAVYALTLWTSIRAAAVRVRVTSWLPLLLCAWSLLMFMMHSMVDFNFFIPANALVFFSLLGALFGASIASSEHVRVRAHA